MVGVASARPVDFSGIWSRTSAGIAKVNLDYTPAAQAIVDGYSYLDDPALRCVSPGLVRVSGWPYPVEIIQMDEQIFFGLLSLLCGRNHSIHGFN